jgi:hypothetical protein
MYVGFKAGHRNFAIETGVDPEALDDMVEYLHCALSSYDAAHALRAFAVLQTHVQTHGIDDAVDLFLSGLWYVHEDQRNDLRRAYQSLTTPVAATPAPADPGHRPREPPPRPLSALCNKLKASLTGCMGLGRAPGTGPDVVVPVAATEPPPLAVVAEVLIRERRYEMAAATLDRVTAFCAFEAIHAAQRAALVALLRGEGCTTGPWGGPPQSYRVLVSVLPALHPSVREAWSKHILQPWVVRVLCRAPAAAGRFSPELVHMVCSHAF